MFTYIHKALNQYMLDNAGGQTIVTRTGVEVVGVAIHFLVAS
jgi:hypothetical protein